MTGVPGGTNSNGRSPLALASGTFTMLRLRDRRLILYLDLATDSKVVFAPNVGLADKAMGFRLKPPDGLMTPFIRLRTRGVALERPAQYDRST